MISRQRFDEIFGEVLALRDRAPYRFAASDEGLFESEAYRALVLLGADAVPFLIERLIAGEVVANEAVLRIAGLDSVALVGHEFPTEDEIGSALVDWYGMQNLVWNAGSPGATVVTMGSAVPLVVRPDAAVDEQPTITRLPSSSGRFGATRADAA